MGEVRMKALSNDQISAESAYQVTDNNNSADVDHIRYFINLVGLGIGVDANIRAERYRCCGPARYDISILCEICAINKNKGPEQKVEAITKDNDSHTNTFPNGCGVIMIQNTIHGGAGLVLAPNAEVDDGYLDIIYTKEKLGCLQTLGLFDKVKKGGKHINDKRVEEKKFKKMKFYSEEEKMVNLDGENCGKTPIEVNVVEGGWEVFVLDE